MITGTVGKSPSPFVHTQGDAAAAQRDAAKAQCADMSKATPINPTRAIITNAIHERLEGSINS